MSDELEVMLSDIRKLVLDAQAERDRYGYIAATIRINAIRHGATDAEAESMVCGEADFIEWLANKVSEQISADKSKVNRAIEFAVRFMATHNAHYKMRPDGSGPFPFTAAPKITEKATDKTRQWLDEYADRWSELALEAWTNATP